MFSMVGRVRIRDGPQVENHWFRGYFELQAIFQNHKLTVQLCFYIQCHFRSVHCSAWDICKDTLYNVITGAFVLFLQLYKIL